MISGWSSCCAHLLWSRDHAQPEPGGFGSGWCENFLFFEELFNSTMNALHLVGNPAFCRPLDVQCLQFSGYEIPFCTCACSSNGSRRAAAAAEAAAGPDRRAGLPGSRISPAFRFPAGLRLKQSSRAMGNTVSCGGLTIIVLFILQ